MDISTWLGEAAAELDLDLDLDHAEIRTLLDVARDAAHQVERPAAPLTTFLLGVAVGRGASLGAGAERLSALAGRVGEQQSAEPEPGPSSPA